METTILDQINQAIIAQINNDWGVHADDILGEMVSSALGVKLDGNVIPNSGKRIRPLLTCYTCGALNGSIERALPIAAAVEILHNFTLVHDDIEDGSPLRHGRETIWKKYGPALAINAGDYMIGLCWRVVHQYARVMNLPVVIDLFEEMYKKVTFGQHLDISFEKLDSVSTEDYLGMISGKTVALIRGSMQLGASVAGCDEKTIQRIRAASKKIGIAFQLQDDYLGIWGEPSSFGKSVSTDISSKKKTFPILYGVETSEEFAALWRAYDGNPTKVAEIAARLEALGAREATSGRVRDESNLAKAILAELFETEADSLIAQGNRTELLALIDRLTTRTR